MTGPTGWTGPRGDSGSSSTGPAGATGPRGISGDSVTGPAGATGPTGWTGPRGISGESVTGPTGPRGLDGLNGGTFTGPTGPSGQLTYLLPSQGNVWVHLGTLQTRMDGNLTQLEIVSQNEFATTTADFVRAQLVFTFLAQQPAVDDFTSSISPFYGAARAYCSGNYWDNSVFAITQTALTAGQVGTFQFYMVMPPNPGKSWMVPTVCPGDTFTFLGTVLPGEPPGARITPLQGAYGGDRK